MPGRKIGLVRSLTGRRADVAAACVRKGKRECASLKVEVR